MNKTMETIKFLEDKCVIRTVNYIIINYTIRIFYMYAHIHLCSYDVFLFVWIYLRI